VNCNIIV